MWAANYWVSHSFEVLFILLQAHWEYELFDLTFEAYPPEINIVIERAFQAKQKFAEWEEEDDAKFQIDFAQNVEIRVNTNKRPVNVKRFYDGNFVVVNVLLIKCRCPIIGLLIAFFTAGLPVHGMFMSTYKI